MVLDLGPGTLPELRPHADFRLLDAVVLSQLHLDHMLDVLALRFALSYNPVAPERPIANWPSPDGNALCPRIASTFVEPGFADDDFSVIWIVEYTPDSTLDIGDFEIRFHPTVHYVPCRVSRVSGGSSGELLHAADPESTATFAPFARG